ncbi:MAG: HEPN-associated N-terminal domain-containing protein [Acetobacter aceti]|uniref:HEPN/RES N-terminal domain-containing protein n=1 Tax=Acetobacter aceti TaxID=435 RepID=A0A1U9KCU9_ACEAC|nr:HEPN-associated N-terminal domain-containing protein [Acetobacter aceti]AQS83634.1 hypothetical protein A0U92_01335 [Acetobacter aceti]
MIIYARGTAIIEHHDSGERFEIDQDELDWKPSGSDDHGMGTETFYEALVEHDELGDLRWTVSEYPVGAENFKKTDVGVHRIVEDFDYGLEHEFEFDDDDPATLRDRFKNNPNLTKAMTKSTVAKYLVDWFHYFYEDPANETPYNSREGGYLYIKGGPYSAEEELRENFEDVVSEDAILEAVEDIQSDGLYDWAPSNRHPESVEFYSEEAAENYSQSEFSFEGLLKKIASGSRPVGLGSEGEKAARAVVLEQIAALKDELPKPTTHGNIGHNQPPQEVELQGEELKEVAKSLDTIEVELASDEPNVETVVQKASLLRKAIEWGAGKMNTTVDAFCKSFGTALGTTAGVAFPAAIVAASHYWGILALLLGSLKGWLLLALGL